MDMVRIDMKMQDNCRECPFLDYEQGDCFASGDGTYRNRANGRVAIRRNVNGSRRRWASVGAELRVIVYSDV